MHFNKILLTVVCSFLLHTALAQNKYDLLWKKVDELLDKKGLPQTALTEVNKIYALAKKEKQEVQAIKALVYRINIEQSKSENDSPVSIKEMEKEITTSSEPSRSILYSILAESYLNYMQQNRWKLYNRTATVNFNKKDIATWGLADFHQKIGEFYLTSLQQKKLLQQTRLAPYDPVIIKGNVRYLRPTLYDLLAHRALEYFKSDERDVIKPAYAFELKDENLFADADKFTAININSADSFSLHHKALLIYQELLAFHLNDNNRDALIDADISRIEFVKQYSVMENKDSLYLKSLGQLANKYGDRPAAAQAWYLIAQWHATKAALYNPLEDSTYRFEYIKAKEICDKVLKQKDSSEGKANCFNLLRSIVSKEINLSTEKVNVPDQAFRTLVSYRNFSQLYFRLIPFNEELKKKLGNTYENDYWKKLTGLKPIRNWEQQLPATNDFQKHSTEIKIDALPIGSYILLASVKEDFSLDKNPLAVQYFYVSNISYINNSYDYFVLNRETGKPLSQATVQTWWNSYDYAKREQTYVKGARYTTDNNGYFKLINDKKRDETNLRLEITSKQDHLFMEDVDYIPFYSPDYALTRIRENISKVFFFTDRSIYRPGQTVYFKGIVIQKDTVSKKTTVVANYKTTVFLYNTNEEEIDSISVTTNEYGSYSGKFILPQNGLNGEFRIEDDDFEGEIHFSVEEYKRPKFYVDYEPLKGTYKVNDNILVKGLAKAYAGNNISGAQVKYRVVRQARFIYPWLYWKGGYPRTANIEITNGTTTTDKDGYFTVPFKAIPDLSIDKALDPVFDYKIIADITDINGETKSAEKIIPISYKALILKITIPEGEKIAIDSFKNIFINTTNLNNEFEPALVKLSIYSLQSPNRLIRKRYWEQPDQFVLSESEFIKYFPNDEYKNESDYRSWNRNEKVFEKADSTRQGKPFNISGNWKEGWYTAEAITKDKYGKEVIDIAYFQLYKEKAPTIPSPAYVRNNRFYLNPDWVDTSQTNKDLTISYETYRDKTLPGSEEKWKLKISGYKKDKVAAELLASMYDESLDQFKPHQWSKPSLWNDHVSTNNWSSRNFQEVTSQQKWNNDVENVFFVKQYDELITNRWGVIANAGYQRRTMVEMNASAPMMKNVQDMVLHDETVIVQASTGVANSAAVDKDEEEKVAPIKENIQTRQNLNETAFFFPDLKTDNEGNIEFSFTMPEALTRWKFQALAHTKDLAFGYSSRDMVTQKDLMVQPNTPRFLREGDKVILTTKIANLTDKTMKGTVQLELLNANTLEKLNDLFKIKTPSQSFNVEGKQSTAASFEVEIPNNYNNALIYRFVAKAGNNSDGEENTLPVLTNRTLVTETMTLPMRGSGTKNFLFEKLLTNKSQTLSNYGLTVEYTSNPAWYAIQALPYLMEYPYECAEQTFNRFYANALATKIVNISPRIKQVFEQWKTTDTSALLSNLQKNQELKAVLLEETPWVLEAKTESQQKKNMALLFDMIRMQKELQSSLDKLMQMQSSNGGFVWFKGGPDDRFITQYIITGIGHLKKLNALPASANEKINAILKKTIPYLDKRIKEDYDRLIKSKANTKLNQLGYIQIQYLYMRSFFPGNGIPGTSLTAVNYYRKQSQQFWLQQNRYMQGMIALQLYRSGDKATANTILKSLKEKALVNEEMGMYWKENRGGYYWHQAPIETQSLLIEAFNEITKDNKVTDDLKTWLLKQKQTQNWSTTKATAEACYALLLQGTDWLSAEPEVIINLGNSTTIHSADIKTEAGTGYFKKSIPGSAVEKEMGNVTVSVKQSTSPSWGAVYWQYFENLDKITAAETPLKLSKKLFVEKNTDRGPVLQPVNEGDKIQIGDKIKVRIELRADRDMEYVHMKDMRASCMEPVNVISSYKWQGGLGYYESTKDASTNFFFNWLPKGTYVFEYPLFVMASGNFSNGITTIQCMYAPEFTSHSEGVRVNVE